MGKGEGRKRVGENANERNPGLATPMQAVLEQTVLTRKLRRAMSPDDIAELAAIATTMPSPDQTQEAEAAVEKEAALLDAAFRSVKREEHALEARLKQVTEQIAVLGHKWDDGKIALPRGHYFALRAKNLKLQQELASRLSFLQSKGAELAGSWANDVIAEGVKRGVDEDWTLVDAVLRCYPELVDARQTVKDRHREKQEILFETDVLAQYGAGHNDEFAMIYCPIAHKRVERGVVAHIVDVGVGAKTAAALFGEWEEHIWNAKNGLVMHKEFKGLIDDDKAVILPASGAPGETELVFLLLTTDIGPRRADVWGHDVLHGRRLRLLNSHRPDKRYLYFRAVVTLLRRRRADVDGHRNGLDLLPPVAKMLWASPGPYLRKAILYRFSLEVGCLTREDADRFWGVENEAVFAALTLEDDRTAAALATQASNAVLAAQGGETKEEEMIMESSWYYDPFDELVD